MSNLSDRLRRQTKTNLGYGWSTNCNSILMEAAAELEASQARVARLVAALNASSRRGNVSANNAAAEHLLDGDLTSGAEEEK